MPYAGVVPAAAAKLPTDQQRERRTTDLAGVITSRIHRGELGPGDRLPAERELAVQLGVGRPKLRDALEALETAGYLVARRGAQGGWFVTELGQPFRRWAESIASELDDIIDFRLAVECQAARFAAVRRTSSDLKALERANKMLSKAENPRDYRLADVAFHGSLALSSRSARVAQAVERARGDLFEPTGELWFDDRAASSLADHQRITAAVADRDPDAAARAMARHIETTRAELHELVR
jgi:GntR family transcriptional repressor for pyruvate dehydrogenase complex